MATKPAAAAVVVAAQAARRNLEKNISSSRNDDFVNDLNLLNELRMALEGVRKIGFCAGRGMT